jgi:hypothetical protein
MTSVGLCPETGKRIYGKEKPAQRACSRAELRGDGPLRHYKCPYHDHWHLATNYRLIAKRARTEAKP